MRMPEAVSAADWEAARSELLAREKRATHELDAVAAARRRLPGVEISEPYTFEGPGGKASLVDLFEGRPQLLLYHFMFAPGVEGWPDAGCPGCSMFIDQVGELTHFHARDTTFVLVSLALPAQIEAYRRRMDWEIPWYSSAGSDFNRDFGVSTDSGETFGLSVFVRDADRVLRTYFTDQRGVEALGSVWTFLDLTPLGRQEQWEDSPEGSPQEPPYQWWRRHDEYANRDERR
jgi:predicted dithiol-disulfide oxidoreductase (DUF899 family)